MFVGGLRGSRLHVQLCKIDLGGRLHVRLCKSVCMPRGLDGYSHYCSYCSYSTCSVNGQSMRVTPMSHSLENEFTQDGCKSGVTAKIYTASHKPNTIVVRSVGECPEDSCSR